MAELVRLQPPNRRTAPAGAAVRFALAAFLFFAVGATAGAQARPSQHEIEAAYLLDFGKFVQLSAGSQALRRATYDICIVGHDSIGVAIEKLAAQQTIDRRAVRIVRDVSASQARTCAIAFIGTHEDDALRESMAALSGADVLTVGDAPNFLDDGGMIEFLVDKNHVRFAVNLDAVRKTHLVLSSQLLRVALYVKGGPQPEGAP